MDTPKFTLVNDVTLDDMEIIVNKGDLIFELS